MVSKFNAKLYFCGKDRKFKRCPNKTLKNFKKSVEEYQNKIYPLAESNRDFQFKMDEILEEIDVIDKQLSLLDKLDNPTDDEIRESMIINKDKLALQKQAHDLRVEKDKSDLANREKYRDLEDELRKTYDTFCVAIFDKFKDGEFLEHADSVDFEIAPHLDELYRLSLAGCKQEEIDDAYKSLLTGSFREV